MESRFYPEIEQSSLNVSHCPQIEHKWTRPLCVLPKQEKGTGPFIDEIDGMR